MGGTEPKSVLPLGEREAPLHYVLCGLRRAGVSDVLVVTGWRPEVVQEYVTERADGLTLAFIRNARFASWGNFHSVRLAVDQSPGVDLLIVNSDVITVPEVYDRVNQTPGDLVLAVEQRARLDSEDMRVQLHGDRVRTIGKWVDLKKSHGEFCGVSLMRPRAALLYAEVASDLEWRAETSLYYEDVYADLLPRVDARAAFVVTGEYAEVDSPEDVGAAVRVVEEHDDAFKDAPATSETV
jgi:choline kinase